MMNLKVYGSGCAKCTKLAAVAEEAAVSVGLEYELEKVTDINEMIQVGIMIPPALAVNGEIKISGKVPSVDEMKELLK